ncbi:DUF4198 domain-containing protein [Tunicatimonas pelagia]|uniref:DUF4198 domain-containing protein n=1 Tax=Tunicatimonas pelagia TaxID=931531 RepID=UPI002665941A|nr:DUF4198 domain-containing protein [Tunicatimonas pelagia]WKN41229.1 DUF4198 domain-containing protein [Tunicatimonas pelagia]
MIKRFAVLALVYLVFSGHDLFLKLDSYFLPPNQPVELYLFNGTFTTSENIIARERMQNVKIVGPAGTQTPEDAQWTDRNKATYLSFTTGEAGTYVAGVSVKPNTIDLSAKDFNEYLEHDGVLDVLAERRKNGQLDEPARELYAKHVKAIFQVGNEPSLHFSQVLGYPVEFVPQQNPYELNTGDVLQLQLLENGKPLANHCVYAAFSAENEHAHSGEEHEHDERQIKTNAQGMLTVNLDHAGQWYLRCIRMVESDADSLEYESNWATLTFEMK